MRFKMNKTKRGDWLSGIYFNKRGINSCFQSRVGGFWFALKLFLSPCVYVGYYKYKKNRN